MVKLFSILGPLRTSQFGSDTLVAIGGDPVSCYLFHTDVFPFSHELWQYELSNLVWLESFSCIFHTEMIFILHEHF